MTIMASRDAVGREPDGFQSLLGKAAAGDVTALNQLKADFPECQDLLARTYGDLAERSQDALITAHAGPDILEHEALRLRMAQLKADLSGPVASPVASILIARIACTWLNASLADLAVARNGTEYHHRARLQKFQSEAERRRYRACRALMQIRKLLSSDQEKSRHEGIGDFAASGTRPDKEAARPALETSPDSAASRHTQKAPVYNGADDIDTTPPEGA